jgi:nitroreductase
MEFISIVNKRYAVKNFDGKKVPEIKVKELLEIIRYAPSSFNIQPWKIVVISNRALLDKLGPASMNQPQVATCSHLLVFCADTNIARNISALEELTIAAGAKKESIKGYIDLMNGFESNLSEEQKLSWSQRQTFLALGNALNGAVSLGFDSCPMEGFVPAEYSKILNLPDNLVPTALCAIGYAADKPRPKLRFAEKDVFIMK